MSQELDPLYQVWGRGGGCLSGVLFEHKSPLSHRCISHPANNWVPHAVVRCTRGLGYHVRGQAQYDCKEGVALGVVVRRCELCAVWNWSKVVWCLVLKCWYASTFSTKSQTRTIYRHVRMPAALIYRRHKHAVMSKLKQVMV
jgi:hypothetical protein